MYGHNCKVSMLHFGRALHWHDDWRKELGPHVVVMNGVLVPPIEMSTSQLSLSALSLAYPRLEIELEIYFRKDGNSRAQRTIISFGPAGLSPSSCSDMTPN